MLIFIVALQAPAIVGELTAASAVVSLNWDFACKPVLPIGRYAGKTLVVFAAIRACELEMSTTTMIHTRVGLKLRLEALPVMITEELIRQF